MYTAVPAADEGVLEPRNLAGHVERTSTLE